MNRERILVIRTGGLGDTVLLWPAVSALRRRLPEARIELMGHRDRCQLLAVPGGVDLALDIEGTGYHHLFEFSGTIPSQVHARFGSYDTILVFAAPGDYALAENLSACGVREVHAFLSFPPVDDGTHVAAYAHQCLAGQDLAADTPEEPLLPVSDDEKTAGRESLDEYGLTDQTVAVIAPGSGSGAKNWPAENYARLIPGLSKLGLQPVLIEGPADRKAVSAVVQASTKTPPIVVKDLPPGSLKGFLSLSRLFVGNDSGPAQLAAAVGTPTVTIFGPTDPERWRPQGPAVSVVRSEVECFPCSVESMHGCQERICLSQTTVDRVLQACRDSLEQY